MGPTISFLQTSYKYSIYACIFQRFFLNPVALSTFIIGAVPCTKTSTHHIGTTKLSVGYRTLCKEKKKKKRTPQSSFPLLFSS